MSYIQLPGNLYTIGYAGFTIQQFIEVIKEFHIHCLIDVRSSPHSTYFRDYNKENMEYLVQNKSIWHGEKIWYFNLKKEFGARQTNPIFLNDDNSYVDFEKFRRSDEFLQGCQRVCNALKKGYNVAFMCAELEPSHCHRSIMISRWFDLHHYSVTHIVPKGTKTQYDIDCELLRIYFKDSYMNNGIRGSLLDLDKTADEINQDKIAQAYQKRNQEIGFRISEEELNR